MQIFIGFVVFFIIMFNWPLLLPVYIGIVWLVLDPSGFFSSTRDAANHVGESVTYGRCDACGTSGKDSTIFYSRGYKLCRSCKYEFERIHREEF